MRFLVSLTLLFLSLPAIGQTLTLENVKISYAFEESNYYSLRAQTPTSIELEKDGKVIKMGLLSNTITQKDILRDGQNVDKGAIPVVLGTAYVMPDPGLEIENISVLFTFNIRYGDTFWYGNTLFEKNTFSPTRFGLFQGIGSRGFFLAQDDEKTISIKAGATPAIVGFGTLPILADISVKSRKQTVSSRREVISR